MLTTIACARVENGVATPSGAAASTSAQVSKPTGPATTTPGSLAPPVAAPKDARDAAACDVLTAAQLDELGLDRATRREIGAVTGFRAGCAWDTTDVTWGVGLAFSEPGSGLGATYQARSSYQHFVPRDIGGHPAVDAQTVYEPEDCYTYVGVADDQALFVNVDNRGLLASRPLTPACERLDQIVTMIIGNLPPLK